MENGNNTANSSQKTHPKRTRPSVARTAKQWVLFGIAAFTAVFMLIGLAFPVLHLEVLGMVRTTLGFDVLSGNMPAAIESVGATLMAFVWLQLVATIVCIVLAVLALTVFPQKTAERVQIAVMIISAVFSLLYMIGGIVATSSSTLAGTTASYALFIVVALLTAGYFLCMKLLPETLAVGHSEHKKQPRRDGEDVAGQIKKFKELYDMGAITEEEYLKKKAELLDDGE